MKGFAMLEFDKVGWIELEKPSAGYLGAVIRPIAFAPCSSDIHTVYEQKSMPLENRVLGHEALGEVVEVGEGVKDFKPGDRVIVGAASANWLSVEAQKGLNQHTDGLLGSMVFTIQEHGCFSEYFSVRQADANLAHIPDDISIESALMIPDMVATGFMGAKNADVKMGESILILGIGPVGLMSIAGAKLRGAGRIIAVGNRPITIEKAKFYGATDIIDYKKDNIVEKLMELTDKQGVDKVIITGGDKNIINTALAASKPGAIISSVNYFPDSGSLPIDNSLWGFGMANKEIKGALTDNGRYVLESYVDLVRYNRVDPSQLITHKFYGFEKIEEALNLMRNKPKDLIKPIVYMDKI